MPPTLLAEKRPTQITMPSSLSPPRSPSSQTLQPAAPSSAPSSEWPPLAPGPSWCGDGGGEAKANGGLATSPTGAKESGGRGHTLVGTSDTSEDTHMTAGHGTGPMAKLALCLPLLDNITNINLRLPTLPGSGSATAAGAGAAAPGAAGTGPAAGAAAAQVQGALLRPGCTLKVSAYEGRSLTRAPLRA